MCVTLRKRLKAVPGFDEEYQFTDDWLTGDGPPKDVVSLLWGTFRRGYPLTMILSVMFPNEMPNTAAEQRLFKKDDAAYNKRSKKFTYTFINSVRDVLSKKQDAMPTLTVLYGEDTTGFVKVCTSNATHQLILTFLVRSDYWSTPGCVGREGGLGFAYIPGPRG